MALTLKIEMPAPDFRIAGDMLTALQSAERKLGQKVLAQSIGISETALRGALSGSGETVGEATWTKVHKYLKK
jgi:hypothetical protein